MANETKTLWMARWKYSRPNLCRVEVVVRPSTYKVTSYQVYLGYWPYGIVYPKDSRFLFETLGDAIRYLNEKGAEVERNAIDTLLKIKGHNRALCELSAELEATGKINLGDT